LCSPPALCDTFPTFVARYSLFVLKVPLNPKQTNSQTCGTCMFNTVLALWFCSARCEISHVYVDLCRNLHIYTYMNLTAYQYIKCNKCTVLYCFLIFTPSAGSGVVKTHSVSFLDPLCFLAGCHTMRLNQALSVLSA